MENQHINESILSEEILEDQKKNRIDHMKYMPGMEDIGSEILDQVVDAMHAYDYDKYTAADVKQAIAHSSRTPEDFAALLSPAALPFIEEIAQAAQIETRKHFGNSVYMFTPIYIANYCENYCIYCGFNCHNKIKRAQLNESEIEKEMQAIAETGLQEILILTGESRNKSTVEYIGNACKIARKYFKVIGLEIYPVNSDEYAYLHACGADYVTVFQETYNSDKYETLHLAGHKRIYPYRVNAQERAIRGGMRGVGFGALLGLMISERMHLRPDTMHIFCRENIRMQKSHFPVRVCARSSITIASILWMFTRNSFCRLCAHIGYSCHLQVSQCQRESARGYVTTL